MLPTKSKVLAKNICCVCNKQLKPLPLNPREIAKLLRKAGNYCDFICYTYEHQNNNTFSEHKEKLECFLADAEETAQTELYISGLLLRFSAQRAHKEFMRAIILKTDNRIPALIGAALGGHLDIVSELISKYKLTFEDALSIWLHVTSSLRMPQKACFFMAI